MKKLTKIISILLMLFASLTFYAFKIGEQNKVKGWFLAGSQTDAYEIGAKDDIQEDGKIGRVGFLRSNGKKIKNDGFGTIMQCFNPADYLEKRVRLSGYIKSKDVKDWAGMWFRVDGDENKSLSFDNMQGRPIKGNTSWKKYEIVLNVSKKSKLIAFGVLLSGTGAIWLDDLTFEIVDNNVPLTDMMGTTNLDKPTNTDFEDSENKKQFDF